MKKNIENELPKIRVLLRTDKSKNAEGKYTLNYLVRYEVKTIKKPTGLYIEEKNWVYTYISNIKFIIPKKIPLRFEKGFKLE